MENVINTHQDFIDNDLKVVDEFSIRFRVDELSCVISLLDLLHIDSSKVRDLYYYYRVILGELPNHYLEYKYSPKFKKREFNKKEIIDSCGQLPLFDSEDIF